MDGMLVHDRVTPVINLLVPIYTLGWRGNLRESVLPKNITQYPWVSNFTVRLFLVCKSNNILGSCF